MRTELLGVRLTPKERKKLKEEAERFGMTESAYLRFLFHKEKIETRKVSKSKAEA